MLFKKHDKHEFLPGILEIEDEPISPLSRIIFWLVVMALVLLLIWSIVGKVDVVVTTRGKVIPKGEVKTIQPLNTGAISKIFVDVNDYVKAGSPLVEIDPSQIEQDLKSMKRNIKVAKLELMRIEALINKNEFEFSNQFDPELYRIEKSIYTSSKNTLTKQLEVKESELKRLAEEELILHNEKLKISMQVETVEKKIERLNSIKELIRKDDIDQTQLELYQANKDFESVEIKISENAIAKRKVREEISLINEDYMNKLQKEYSEKSKNFEYLVADYEKSSFLNKKQLILSPINGFISQKLIHTIGGVVTPAEKLFVIVPEKNNLMIKTTALSKDTGNIKEGEEVTIKIDAYEYQKFGVVHGVVDHISKDSIEDEQLGLVYEVYIKPDSLTLDRSPDKTISTGMSVTAEMKVDKRRLIELFVFPLIRYFDEGTSVR